MTRKYLNTQDREVQLLDKELCFINNNNVFFHKKIWLNNKGVVWIYVYCLFVNVECVFCFLKKKLRLIYCNNEINDEKQKQNFAQKAESAPEAESAESAQKVESAKFYVKSHRICTGRQNLPESAQKAESAHFYVKLHRILYWKVESAQKAVSAQKVESAHFYVKSC